MREGLNAKKATLAQGQPFSLNSIPANTEMNITNLLNQPDNTGIIHVGAQAHLSIISERAWFKDFVAFWGVANLGVCMVSANGPKCEVSGSAHGLTSLLRHWDGVVVDAGRDLRWVDPATGKVFPLRGLAHLAEVVAEYAERRAVSV